MARNRQRAKERQARRKEARGGNANAAAPARPPAPAPAEPGAAPEPEPRQDAEPTVDDVLLRAGAPPQDVGRSDEVLDYEQDLDESEDEEHYDPAEDRPEEDDELTPGPRGHRGDAAAQHKDRSRLVQFLYAVVAELRRVQWPDRQTLTTLTGVVLGFVLIAGGYLGLLDAIFSRIIQGIL